MEKIQMRKGLVFVVLILLLGMSALSPVANSITRINNTQQVDTSEIKNEQVKATVNQFVDNSVFFTENKGQFPEDVLFQTHVNGATVYLCKDKVVSVFIRGNETSSSRDFGLSNNRRFPTHNEMLPQPMEMLSTVATFVGANRHAQIQGKGLLSNYNNYFIGNNPEKWFTDVPNYQEVVYTDLYSGIDLRYYFQGHALKYDFIVQPGMDPSRIQIRYDGVQNLRISPMDNLEMETQFGQLSEKKPVIYQEKDTGIKTQVQGRYELKSSNVFGFTLDERYDPSYSLVIDPELVYSTFLGGTSNEYGSDIAVNNQGYAYITGETSSSDFPTTPGTYDTTYNGGVDVFMTKLSPNGSSLVYTTYLGGTSNDYHFYSRVAVEDGYATITGHTTSSDFPTTPGAYDTTYNGGGSDVFVTKLSPNGSNLVYSTYLGGTDYEYGYGTAVDANGYAYITGFTMSSNFPTTPGAYDRTYDGVSDAFVTKLSPSGNTLVYSTYLGGTGFEIFETGLGIAVDNQGNTYITGETGSSDFPTTPGAYDTTFKKEGYDAFVTKLSPTGNTLIYSTYLRGISADDWGADIAVDNQGNGYITGFTYSSDFPTTTGAYDTTKNGFETYDVFVTKLSPSGNTLIYSTYLGGTSDDYGYGIAVDNQGNAYITGYTTSSNFPTTTGAYDTTCNGGRDAFVTKLSPFGNMLNYSTYLGGIDVDAGNGIAVDADGYAYITGYTESPDFPTTTGAYDTTFNGNLDVFVSKFSFGPPNNPPNIPNQPWGSHSGETGITEVFYTRATDPDNDKVAYGWDWNGDGTVDEWDDNNGDYYVSGARVSAAHTWYTEGTYDVRVKAKDIYGSQSGFSDKSTIIIHYRNHVPYPPNNPVGPITLPVGITGSYSTRSFDIDNDSLSYGWDWNGDNIVDEWTNFYPSYTTIQTSHSWGIDGTYYIRVKAKDTHDAISDWSGSLQVIIGNGGPKPVASIVNITPNPAAVANPKNLIGHEDPVTFIGDGYNPYGSSENLEYIWTSSIDGEIGSQKNLYQK